jgi:hypothetical protein
MMNVQMLTSSSHVNDKDGSHGEDILEKVASDSTVSAYPPRHSVAPEPQPQEVEPESIEQVTVVEHDNRPLLLQVDTEPQQPPREEVQTLKMEEAQTSSIKEQEDDDDDDDSFQDHEPNRTESDDSDYSDYEVSSNFKRGSSKTATSSTRVTTIHSSFSSPSSPSFGEGKEHSYMQLQGENHSSSSEAELKCNVCHMAFTKPNLLVLHMKTHAR